MTPTEPKKVSTLAKWLAVGMSLFMLAYGVFIMTTEQYYGYTSKLGGAEVSVVGSQAVLIGVAIIIIGLTPMCLWAKSATGAGFWAGICMITGIIMFLAPFYMH